MGIVGKILPLVAAGLGIFFIANILSRPAQASMSAGALGETGSAIGTSLTSIGAGAGDIGVVVQQEQLPLYRLPQKVITNL